MPTLRIRPTFVVSPTADHLSDARLVQGRLRSPEQVHRVLYIPRLPSCDGPSCRTDGAETEGTEVPGDAVYHRDVHLPGPYQASASYGLGSRLELGLDQQDRLPQRRSGREEAFERDRERDEREVGHQKVGVERQIFCGQLSHVGPASRQQRPSTRTPNSPKAASSFSPARDTKRSARSTDRGSSAPMREPALVTTTSPTRTLPERIRP